MNKTEFVKAVAHQAGESIAKSAPMVDAMIRVIEDTLKNGESIVISGFGTFEVKEREARKGRNPATGAEIDIPASRQPSFKAGKTLKDIVNQQ